MRRPVSRGQVSSQVGTEGAEVLSDAKTLMAVSLPYDLWPYRYLRCANLLRDFAYLMTAWLPIATQPKPAFRPNF